MARVLKATQARDALGTIVDARHEGHRAKRPTEKGARLDNWSPPEQKTPNLFQRIRALRNKMPGISWEDAEEMVLAQGTGGEDKG
jgi:hypothetical protein